MSSPRIIAFYLPQYHPIPENDEWWGMGFTDWLNVAKARPRFYGHYQPQLPSDLGFYDLRQDETRIAQADLARQHGIAGFCYYHYWFNGKLLLERPFEEVLLTGKPDFPFCLCWANENWTKQWDGMENEILMRQKYDEYDPVAHFVYLQKAFEDNRYIRVNGKPIFIVYRADSIPGISKVIGIWRKLALEAGLPGLFLCSVKSFHNVLSEEETIRLGFDALVGFFPTKDSVMKPAIRHLPKYYLNSVLNRLISRFGLEKKLGVLNTTKVYNYEQVVNRIISTPRSNYKTFECVSPSWDNSSRKKKSGVFQNNDAVLYSNWLGNAFDKVRHLPDDEQIVFVNAWNEWAEGCHLEPDIKNGRKFLLATLEFFRKFVDKKTN
jgi:lipopolysaccharide biosynthesis protein